MDFTRLFDILPYQQRRYAKNTALAGRENGTWRTWPTDELLAERDRLSTGLLQLGLRHGDRVGIFAHCGSPKWNITDAAMMQIGLVPVPMHATARPDELAHIVQDSGMKACFVSNLPMLERWNASSGRRTADGGREAAGSGQLHIFLFENTPAEGTRTWDELCCEPSAHDLEKIQYYRDGIGPDALATLIYTSGSTGLPKGVMLSHANIVSNIKSVLAIVPVDNETVAVSFLPMSHIFERMVTFVYMAAGVEIWYADSVEGLPKTLLKVRPHFFTAVPRILERMHERMLERRARLGFVGKKVFDWALALGERYPFAGAHGMPILYRLKLALARMLVFRRFTRALGGRAQGVVVGAAALQPRLGRLLSATGVDVREGYGLTETSPVVAFNRFEPGGVHFGTVGMPVPGVEIRIAAPDERGDGEIEVRGPNVMLGYLNLPDETAARFTPDGWLRTGDVGRMEHKRFLKITGRKADFFKTTTGKFVAPEFVEQRLRESPFVAQCMVVGLNRPFVAALLVPNFEQLEAWCRENRVHWTAPQFMVLNPKVEKFFRAEIERINTERLSATEKIQAFQLLHEAWTPENGLLTPTLKLRRQAIVDRFSEQVGVMFGQ